MEAQIERGIERGSVDAKNWVSFLFFGQRTYSGVPGKKSNPAHDRSHFPSHLSHPFIAQHWAPHPLIRPLTCSLPVYSLLFSFFLPPISPPIRPVCIHLWIESFSLEKEFNSPPPPFISPLIFRKLLYPTSFEVLFLLPPRMQKTLSFVGVYCTYAVVIVFFFFCARTIKKPNFAVKGWIC